MNILEEILVSEDEKVVVFSQWERMTRIVAEELQKKNIGYESLNGSVPSKDREKLFTNFRNDPKCRIFLSTDAGGVGLNLQSAAYLINLDLPWNPAVLEQRIARIHRMGQKKNVQIINLIAQGTIEEEMLAKLKFKSSLAAGILDKGESSVFLGQSKFNELMNQVKDLTEKTTPAVVTPEEIVEQEPQSPEEKTSDKIEKHEKHEITEPILGTERQLRMFDDDELQKTQAKTEKNKANISSPNELIETGMNFFGKLMQTLSDETQTEKLVETLVKKDEGGNTYLKIPVKDEKIIQTGLKLLQQFLGGK
jgi:superfamily II DNA/RNA helicase